MSASMRNKMMRGHPLTTCVDAAVNPGKRNIASASLGYRMQRQSAGVKKPHLHEGYNDFAS